MNFLTTTYTVARTAALAGVLLLTSLGAMAQRQKPWENIKYPEAKNFTMPKVEEFKLPNGITFYLVENRELPVIDLNLVVRTGATEDPAGKEGLAGMTGQLIREGGSASYPADKLNEMLEKQAAEIETGIGFNSGSASLRALTKDFNQLLPVFLDVILNPAFPEDKIDQVKKQTKSGIGRRNDDPQSVAAREFDVMLYGRTSPYGRYEEYATIDAISREDMLAFHKKHFTGSNFWIGVVGDFNTAEMKKKLTETFGKIPKGTPLTLNQPAVKYTYPVTVKYVNKGDVTQSVVRMGHIGGKRLIAGGKQNPDYASIQLYNEILSGGFSGRLFQNVRTNLGLAYSVNGGYSMPAQYEGVFFTGVMTKSSTTSAAIDAILEQVKRLQTEAVSEQELADAKDRILNSLVFRYPSLGSVLFERMNTTYQGLPADAFEQYIDMLKKVTVADIQRVANQYVKPDKFQILVVGNKAEFGDQLNKYGDVKELDVTIPKPASTAKPMAAGDTKKGAEYFGKMVRAINPASKKVTGVLASGTGVVYSEQIPGGKADVKQTLRINFPGAYSLEVNIPAFGVTQILKLDEGKATMEMMGNKQDLPGAMAVSFQKTLDRNYLNLSNQGDLVPSEYLGTMEVSGKQAHHIRITVGEQKVSFFLDPTTLLPLATESTDLDPQTGSDKVSREYFLQWKAVDGIQVVSQSRDEGDGKVESEFTYSDITLNPAK